MFITSLLSGFVVPVQLLFTHFAVSLVVFSSVTSIVVGSEGYTCTEDLFRFRLAPRLSGCLIVSIVTFKDQFIYFFILSKKNTVYADVSSSFLNQCFNCLKSSFSKSFAFSNAILRPALAFTIAFLASSLEYLSLYFAESSRAVHAVVDNVPAAKARSRPSWAVLIVSQILFRPSCLMWRL